MKNRYVKVILSLCLAACAAGLCISLSSSHKEEPVPVPVRVQLRLNESLTNEVSDTSALAGMDKRIENYMRQWALRGTSLAIMRNDSLVYAKGYGWADKELDINMEPCGFRLQTSDSHRNNDVAGEGTGLIARYCFRAARHSDGFCLCLCDQRP